MKWWKIEIVRYDQSDTKAPPVLTMYDFGPDLTELLQKHQLYGHPHHYPIGNEVDPAEVPPVKRGLTEASLEELLKEINKRGFKVVQQ